MEMTLSLLSVLMVCTAPLTAGQLCEKHWAPPCGDKRNHDVRVQYIIQNRLREAGPIFSSGQILYVAPGSNTFDMMQLAGECNDEMALNYTVHPEFGVSVQALNDVFANVDKSLFWAFMKKEPAGLCLLPVGVSTYKPVDGDKLIHSMETYGIFDELPTCGSGENDPHK